MAHLHETGRIAELQRSLERKGKLIPFLHFFSFFFFSSLININYFQIKVKNWRLIIKLPISIIKKLLLGDMCLLCLFWRRHIGFLIFVFVFVFVFTLIVFVYLFDFIFNSFLQRTTMTTILVVSVVISFLMLRLLI